MWIEYLRIARRALSSHKFRSALTVLSITIGAFSIVLMSSLAQSGSTTLFRSFEELGGGRIIMVGPKEVEREEAKASSYTRGLTIQDRDLLYSAVPHVIERTMFSRLGRKDAVAPGRQVGVPQIDPLRFENDSQAGFPTMEYVRRSPFGSDALGRK